MSSQEPRTVSKEQLAAVGATWPIVYLGNYTFDGQSQPVVNVTNPGGWIKVVVNVEIHDSAGNKLQQRYYEGETFLAGKTQPYFGPVYQSGRYELFVGIYALQAWQNGQPPISWNDLGQFTI
jgi:hypothetical protein